MAKKRKKDEKTKAEEDAEREETHRLGQERIALPRGEGARAGRGAAPLAGLGQKRPPRRRARSAETACASASSSSGSGGSSCSSPVACASASASSRSANQPFRGSSGPCRYVP